ncbi:MAG: sensor domain-containing diguanylate cyclase [Bradymonadales bacterium]|nr:MAG: sensor domain-containing diguanylate cyclase [Bradymonadales bacterium]
MKKKAKSKNKPSSASKRPARSLKDLAYPKHLIENEVIEELRNTVDRLQILDSLGKMLTSCLDLSEILQTVVEKVGHLLGSKQLGLVLMGQRSKQFYFQYPRRKTEDDPQRYDVGRGLVGRCLESGKAELIHNPCEDPQFDREVDSYIAEEASSMLLLPIISKGRALGVLVVVTLKDREPLEESSLKLAETMIDYLAIAVENSIHYQRVQDLTITDDLTQLYNSRYLPIILEREIARSKRYGEELSMVFLDLDNFKSVNDQYGHIAGSRLLTEFGDFLFQHIRSSDIGIRYGGDEFVLVLPRTPKKDAVLFVERAIQDLHKKDFLTEHGLQIKQTASFGVSTFPEDGEGVDQIIAAADRAMYQVKRGSKDGVYATNLAANHDQKKKSL